MDMTNSQQTTTSPAENRKGGTMNETVVWPTKTRELHNHYFDSTIWDDLRFRDDAIILSTYAKPGTTWITAEYADAQRGDPPAPEWTAFLGYGRRETATGRWSSTR
jgi:hypothetical protein